MGSLAISDFTDMAVRAERRYGREVRATGSAGERVRALGGIRLPACVEAAREEALRVGARDGKGLEIARERILAWPTGILDGRVLENRILDNRVLDKRILAGRG